MPAAKGSMKIEFVGGPRDGDVLAVPTWTYEFRIPLATPIEWFAKGEQEPRAHTDVRTGTYRISDDPKHPHDFVWCGED